MKSEDIHTIARQTMGRIFEDAAFLFTDQLAPSDYPAAQTWAAWGVSLAFHGPQSGEMHLWASSTFAKYAAANMLGIEIESDSAQQKGLDALKEILNMIVGNFITTAWGQEPIFDLGLPRSLQKDDLVVDHRDPKAVWMQADSEPVLVVVRMKE